MSKFCFPFSLVFVFLVSTMVGKPVNEVSSLADDLFISSVLDIDRDQKHFEASTTV